MIKELGKTLRGATSELPASLVRRFARPTALLFHGVESSIDDPRLQSNHHDSTAFSEIARLLRDNFDVLPLSAMRDVLRRPGKHPRSVFLTADDGYANNLSRAAEILAAYSLPWTLFVSTHHIDSGDRNPILLARLFFLFAPRGNYGIPHLTRAIALGSTSERDIAGTTWIPRLKALDAPRAREAVAAMVAAFAPAQLAALLERFRSDSFLDWQGVARLKQMGVEIGAHAHFHWPLHAGQSRAYLTEQAALSRARIEAEIGPCRYFAYPFGNVGDISRDAWHAVRDAGYEFAFTTLSGTLDAGDNPYLLPRYGLAPREPRLPSLIPSLRLGNPRLRAFQKQIAD